MKIVNDIKLPKKNKKTSYNPVYWYGTKLFSLTLKSIGSNCYKSRGEVKRLQRGDGC